MRARLPAGLGMSRWGRCTCFCLLAPATRSVACSRLPPGLPLDATRPQPWTATTWSSPGAPRTPSLTGSTPPRCALWLAWLGFVAVACAQAPLHVACGGSGERAAQPRWPCHCACLQLEAVFIEDEKDSDGKTMNGICGRDWKVYAATITAWGASDTTFFGTFTIPDCP